MRAAILYGSYTILNILAVILTDHWLSRSSEKYRGSVGLRVIVCFLYISLAFFPVLANLIQDNLYKYYLLRYSYIWMGFIMYYGGMLLIATVIEVIVRIIAGSKARKLEKEGVPFSEEEKEENRTTSRRISALVFSLILILTIGLNVYGMIHAQHTYIKHYDISIDKSVKHTKKLRVALIADLHLSYNSNVEMIQRMVDKLNAEKPDVVFVAGDLFSSNYSSIKEPSRYIKALKQIQAKDGVFWVYGNHDVEEPLFCGFGLAAPEDAVRTKKMRRFIKRCGFKTLEDKCTAIARGEVQVAGRADAQKPVDKAKNRMTADELLNDLDNDKPIILLEHEPGDYKNIAANGVDISLSGHTHAGQIFPGTIFTRLMNDMVYGLDWRYDMQVLVTSGVGCYGPPLRIGTNSEVVIADMTFK